MTVENSSTIYSNLLEKFAPDIPVPKTVRWQKSKFSQFITSDESPMNVLILDEMDQLSSRNEKVLYDLFELAAGSSSRMILIGIANGLDLLERVLPNLPKSCKPNQMNFQPYSFQQISTLIKVYPSLSICKFKSIEIKLHSIKQYKIWQIQIKHI